MSHINAERLDMLSEETQERVKALVRTMAGDGSSEEKDQAVTRWRESFDAWVDSLPDAEAIYAAMLRVVLMGELVRWIDEA